MENLALVTLWDYVYKAKFDPHRYSAVKFESYHRWNIDRLALILPNLKLESQAVSNVPDICERTAAAKHD